MAEIKVLKSVEVLKLIDERTSQLKVVFTDGDEAQMFELMSSVTQYIDKEVIISFREEIIDSRLTKVVSTLALRSTVITLDKETEIKLYADQMPDIGSTIQFKNLQEGASQQNCIVYCDSVWKGSSSKATWVSLRILDKKRNVAELKVFNPENGDISVYAKKYLVCDIICNKYGFNTSAVYIKEDITISANPEIALARQYIMNVTSDDKELQETIVESNLLDAMGLYSAPDLVAETGSVTIQTAMELSLARDLLNLTKKVDVKFLYRLIIMSKMYVYTHTAENPMSKELQSIIRTTMYRKIVSRKLLAALEGSPNRRQVEREIYEKLSATTFAILQSKYTTGLIESTDAVWKKV